MSQLSETERLRLARSISRRTHGLNSDPNPTSVLGLGLLGSVGSGSAAFLSAVNVVAVNVLSESSSSSSSSSSLTNGTDDPMDGTGGAGGKDGGGKMKAECGMQLLTKIPHGAKIADKVDLVRSECDADADSDDGGGGGGSSERSIDVTGGDSDDGGTEGEHATDTKGAKGAKKSAAKSGGSSGGESSGKAQNKVLEFTSTVLAVPGPCDMLLADIIPAGLRAMVQLGVVNVAVQRGATRYACVMQCVCVCVCVCACVRACA